MVSQYSPYAMYQPQAQPLGQPYSVQNAAALAALALLIKSQSASPDGGIVSGGTVVVTPSTPANPYPVVPPHKYDRHVYVDLVDGDDAQANVGAYETPYKTLEKACGDIGRPTTRIDFERHYILHVRGQPETVPSGVVGLPPSRRLTLMTDGSCNLPSMTYSMNRADRFGSALQFYLNIVGVPESMAQAFDSTPKPYPVGNAQIVGATGRPALLIQREGEALFNGFVLSLVNVGVSNGGIVFQGFAAFPLEPILSFRDCIFNLSTLSQTWGIEGSGSTPIGILFECTRCLFLAAADRLMVQNVAHMQDCVVSADVTVAGAPDPSFVRSIKGCNFLASSSWTGPAGSMRLDGVTNFFAKLNGAGIAGAAKTITEDVVP